MKRRKDKGEEGGRRRGRRRGRDGGRRGSHLMIERMTGMYGSEMVPEKEKRKNDW